MLACNNQENVRIIQHQFSDPLIRVANEVSTPPLDRMIHLTDEHRRINHTSVKYLGFSSRISNTLLDMRMVEDRGVNWQRDWTRGINGQEVKPMTHLFSSFAPHLHSPAVSSQAAQTIGCDAPAFI